MIPAFYNGFVNGLAKEAYFPYERRLSSGTVQKGQTACRIAYVRRLTKTSNPVRYLGGIIPYRYPSSYTRTASIWTPIPCDLVGSSNRYRKGVFDISIAAAGSLDVGLVNSDGGMSELSNQQAQADVECLQKLSESKVQMGQFLAEAVRSADMVAGAFIGLVKPLLDIKRGRVKSVRRRLGHRSLVRSSKDASQLWLEYQYGWKPLCSDLYTLYNESIRTLDNPLLLTAVRNINSHQQYRTTNNVNFDLIEADCDVINTCKITAQISEAYLHQATSLGLVNPLSLGWELVPYSFVIDWVCPVGNFFEALSAPAGLTFVSGFRGQRCETRTTGTWEIPSGFSGSPERVFREGFSYKRSALGGFPAPRPYGKSPFSTTRVTNALALFRQLLR